MDVSAIKVLLAVLSVVHPILIPDCKSNTVWFPATLDISMCPLPLTEYTSSIFKEGQIGLFSPEDMTQKLVDGAICYIKVSKVKCTTGFFWSQNIQKSVSFRRPPKSACRDHIDQQREEISFTEAEFPTPVCKFQLLSSTTTTTESETLIVEPHPIEYSYRDQLLLNSVLLRGKCRERICPTYRLEAYWIAKDPLPDCPPMTRHPAKIYFDGQKPVSVISDVLPPLGLKGSCRTVYCGQPGIRTVENIFINISGVDITSQIPTCTERHQLEGFSKDISSKGELLTFEEHTKYTLCIYAVILMKSLEVKHPYLLSVFQPQFAGSHPCYRIFNRTTIMKAICPYIHMDPVGVSPHGVIGTDKHSKPVIWKFWDALTKEKCPSLGPNGIIRDEQCKVHYPHEYVGSDIMSLIGEMMRDHAPIEKSFDILTRNTQSGNVEISDKRKSQSDSRSFIDAMSDDFTTLKADFLIAVKAFAGFCVVCVLYKLKFFKLITKMLCCCISLGKLSTKLFVASSSTVLRSSNTHRLRRRQRRHEEIEMNPFA
ncbi:putative glycoprotein [Xinzhou nematode virus 4]|uniref:Putative glycoprotein n=1 Tax=Xinzhou nematode virus 4 TaxID=1923772 RepID=A0A1L3KNB2_9RHAB|nr:putative glycoprotein [Xinzhou nematode virus 4]APG78856.1 putative glycoprotein [Xinzhou nematode virus 4]